VVLKSSSTTTSSPAGDAGLDTEPSEPCASFSSNVRLERDKPHPLSISCSSAHALPTPAISVQRLGQDPFRLYPVFRPALACCGCRSFVVKWDSKDRDVSFRLTRVSHHLEIALFSCEVGAQVVNVGRTRPHTARNSARYSCNIPSFKQLIYTTEGHGPHLRAWDTTKAGQREMRLPIHETAKHPVEA
jgi:hypothetical protein